MGIFPITMVYVNDLFVAAVISNCWNVYILIFVFRIHTVRFSNPVAAAGNAHRQCARALHGPLPAFTNACTMGTDGKYSSSS